MAIFSETWHWAISGFLFGVIMLLLNYWGGYFGLSSSYRALCSIAGAGNVVSFFKFDWRAEKWHLVFIGGITLGGFISFLLQTPPAAGETVQLPSNLFSSDTPVTLIFLFLGSALSGFGARYAGGCTSGHFVSGISNLQMPSFLTLMFFMIGGVLTSIFVMPYLNNL